MGRRNIYLCVLLGCIVFVAACEATVATDTPAPPTATAVATAAATAVPSAPAAAWQVTAEAQDTTISLSWTALSGASGYFVYRDGNANPLTVKPITTTHYLDIGLTNGRTYTYTVAPVSADGTAGARSRPVAAAPKAP